MMFYIRILLVAAFVASLTAVLDGRAMDGTVCHVACLGGH